jgi:predicted RNase H-like HicB family nuclease
MELEGKVWKDGNFWLIEVPTLNLMTQGKTKKEALAMAQDAVFGLLECYFESEVGRDLNVGVIDYRHGVIGVESNNNKLLLALSLIRQREKSGSTIKEAAERLGSKSPNAYAQYERGLTNISIDKFEHLLNAANPTETRRLRLV